MFQEKLTEGFRSTIIPTGSKTKQRSKAATEETYNTELLISIIYLFSIGEIEFEYLLDFEVSPLRTLRCNEMGEPRYTKA